MTARHDSFEAFRHRDFRLLFTSRFAATLGEIMVNVAIGWYLYERTGDAFALGLVGLAQFIPVIMLALITGQAADRYNRKWIVLGTQLGLGLFSLGLAWLAATDGSIALMYGCIFGIGVMQAFHNPASSSLFAQTIPKAAYANAATWSSSSWQLASVLGPALGGLLIALFSDATPVFVLNGVTSLIFVALVTFIRYIPHTPAEKKEAITWGTLLAGFHFIRSQPVMLGAITLDLFAVLFGGATALLPVYAKDILLVGPEGLGWLRAAPSIGALGMAIFLASRPPFRNAGRTLLLAVAGFGVATIVFGFSTNFLLSLAMLAALGALDNISVVIRSTLFLTLTPDDMRGRVSAVNSVFIGASNELGAFQSGAAAWFGGQFLAGVGGTIFAVVSGGIGTLIVVYAVARTWPQLGALKRLSEPVEAVKGIEPDATQPASGD